MRHGQRGYYAEQRLQIPSGNASLVSLFAMQFQELTIPIGWKVSIRWVQNLITCPKYLETFFKNGTLFFRISIESFAFKSQTQKIQWRQPRFNNGSATSWNHHWAEKVSNQNRPFSGQWFFPTSGPYPFNAINHSNLAFCGNFCS